jgi:hypothetical protein
MNKARVFIANRLGDEMKYASKTNLGTTMFMISDIYDVLRMPSYLPNFLTLIWLLLYLYHILVCRPPLSLPFLAPLYHHLRIDANSEEIRQLAECGRLAVYGACF